MTDQANAHVLYLDGHINNFNEFMTTLQTRFFTDSQTHVREMMSFSMEKYNSDPQYKEKIDSFESSISKSVNVYVKGIKEFFSHLVDYNVDGVSGNDYIKENPAIVENTVSHIKRYFSMVNIFIDTYKRGITELKKDTASKQFCIQKKREYTNVFKAYKKAVVKDLLSVPKINAYIKIDIEHIVPITSV